MGRFLTERRFIVLVFVAFAALTLWGTLHHEAWGDETDVWLVMRDGDAGAIFGQTAYSYRGTPLLWYLAVWPFAAAGAPYLSMQLLNLFFAWASVWLVLRYAPFPRTIRALFAFSYYPAFEYAALARPYALLMLLMLAAAALWQQRHERPLPLAIVVFLMANTAVHGLIVGALIGLALLWEWLENGTLKRRLPPIAVMLAGGLLSVIQLWPKAGGQLALTYRVELETLWYSLASAFFPDARIENAMYPAIAIVVLTTIAISRCIPALLIYWGSMIPMLFIFVFVWIGGLRHAGILLILTVAVLWIAQTGGQPLRLRKTTYTLVGIALVYSVWFTWHHTKEETLYAYSDSKEMATWIRTHGLDRLSIAAHRTARCSSILAYLPGKKFWSPSTGRDESFINWSGASQTAAEAPFEQAVRTAQTHFRGQKWLFLSSGELPEPLRPQFRLLYRTQDPIWEKFGENYALYEPR
jgi:hypothetical protein